MTHFICPICSNPLIENGKMSLRCLNGHCFDRSSAGYVNLLRSNTASHGDDKFMVAARRSFLGAGYYQPLRDTLCDKVGQWIPPGSVLLDAGCGEGYYTSAVADTLAQVNNYSSVIAVDVSKTAVAYACKRCKSCDFAVASVYALPIADKSVGMVISVFSPFAKDEFSRVLTDGGYIISVIPLQKHLFSLKALIYDTPYENEVQPFELDGYTLVDKTELRYDIHIDSGDRIRDLFAMTPYYYKTPDSFRHRLDSVNALDTEVQFCVLIYSKKV